MKNGGTSARHPATAQPRGDIPAAKADAHTTTAQPAAAYIVFVKGRFMT
jgi:hypothetical protein